MVRPFESIFSSYDSLRHDPTQDKSVSSYLAIGAAYAEMGFIESAIEHGLRALDEEPENPRVLGILAGWYEEVKRYFPERKVLERLVVIEPGDSSAMLQFKEVLRRW